MANTEWVTDVGERLQEAMSACFEKKAIAKFDHVDIGKELKKRNKLDNWSTEVGAHHFVNPFLSLAFFAQAWPPTLAVGKLAATIKKKKKQGQENVFVCVDLKECVRVSSTGVCAILS